MASLANLIPSPGTPGAFQCRSAAVTLSSFPGFTAPTYVSCMLTVGTRIFGMVSSGRNAGKDEPFCFDTATGLFVTISGVTSGNTPASPATSGDWTPPVMAAVGSYVILAHVGFDGTGANFFGVISGAGGASPAWSSSNTGTHALPSVPQGCAEFNGRIYFCCGNTTYYTDVLNPLNMANATNSLSFGGSDNITAVAQQPFFATQTGGISAALLVFKANEVHQITGDLALNTLVKNKIIDGIGTLSARSIATTTQGVAFLARDGIRVISLTGQINDPYEDISSRFLNTVHPSRVAAAYNEGIYRVCGNFNIGGVSSVVDYWYDCSREIWTGPHTIAYDCIVASGNLFVLSYGSFGAILESSNPQPSGSDSFVENGSSLIFVFQTSIFPDKLDPLSERVVLETGVLFQFLAQTNITAYILDQSGALLDSVSFVTPFLPATGMSKFSIPWDKPVTGDKISFSLSGLSSSGIVMSEVDIRMQESEATALQSVTSTIPAVMDWGSVTDSAIFFAMDWGSVTDPVLFSVDFGVL